MVFTFFREFWWIKKEEQGSVFRRSGFFYFVVMGIVMLGCDLLVVVRCRVALGLISLGMMLSWHCQRVGVSCLVLTVPLVFFRVAVRSLKGVPVLL